MERMITMMTTGIERNADTQEWVSSWTISRTWDMMVLRATIEDVKCIGRFPFAEGMPQREPRQVIHPTSRIYGRLALSRRDLRSYGR